MAKSPARHEGILTFESFFQTHQEHSFEAGAEVRSSYQMQYELEYFGLWFQDTPTHYATSAHRHRTDQMLVAAFIYK